MAALGDDGRGYDLARKLEACGVWRSWLGDSLYPNFLQFLSSPSAWDCFMTPNDSKSRDQIHLQLRVRALLFDKASLSLFLPTANPSSSSILSNLNPSYLRLHGDDVYFTLDDGTQPPRDKRFRQEGFPENWYNKFIENYRASKPYVSSFSNRESDRRNPSEMSAYLRLQERHKRRRIEFKKDESGGLSNSNTDNKLQSREVLDSDTLGDDDSCFFPETMFMMNCVPDSAIVPRLMVEEKQKVEVLGVLDSLPQMPTKSSIMLERLGISMEEQGPGHSRTKVGSDGNRNHLSQEQAMQISKKIVARVLSTVGYEGASEISIDVLSKFLSCHVSKLGCILKVLTDSYRKQYTAMELLKMFLQVAGKGCNLAALAEHLKDSRSVVQQSTPHNQIQSMQSQLSLSQQTLQLPQQIPRQMHPQMVHPHNLTLQQQQQLERMRQHRATSSPRPALNMDKDRPLVQVKLENPPDLPMDSSALSAMNSRAQMQRRQQQIAALQRMMGSSGNQMRQQANMQQMPPMQSQNMSAIRAPPVKVEAFQELMGGDASLKQSSDENRLTSPSN